MMTKRQRACLEKAVEDGDIIEGGPDDSGIDPRVRNTCIRKGWLSYEAGPEPPHLVAH